MFASPQYRRMDAVVGPLWRQLGAVAAALLLAVLAYSAFRGDFAYASFFGATFGTANLGRLLFAHDALATEAVAVLVTVALVGAAAAWRGRGSSGWDLSSFGPVFWGAVSLAPRLFSPPHGPPPPPARAAIPLPSPGLGGP